MSLYLGTTKVTPILTVKKSIPKIKNIYCSHNTSWVLKTDGTLWGCGWNGWHQQGTEDDIDVKDFTLRLTDVIDVACSDITTWAIKSDNTLWGCGGNNYGQQGTGIQPVYGFSQKLTNVKQVACTSTETWALKYDGTLWSCGRGHQYQQGDGTTNDCWVFVERLTDVTYVTCAGTIYNSGNAAGARSQTWALKYDGTLWHTGSSYYGQGSTSAVEHKVFTQVFNIN